MPTIKISTQQINHLIQEATVASENAYAPYSHFYVGAALLLKDGTVVRGNNVENASYGLSICAERVAIVSAIAQGKQDFEAMAVVTSISPPASPCGACRQFIAEFSSALPLILANKKGEVVQTDLAEILPLQFSKHDLKSS